MDKYLPNIHHDLLIPLTANGVGVGIQQFYKIMDQTFWSKILDENKRIHFLIALGLHMQIN